MTIVWVQARRTPTNDPEYVALGSSFAAGAGLGPLQKGSPLLCARSVGGYPQQVARTLGLSIVDMACGGAVTRHLLHGGQFFQGPQSRVVDKRTRLVTITVGGNDTLYTGDLSQLAARNTDTVWGWLVRNVWSGPKTEAERNYPRLRAELVATIQAIRRRQPKAAVVLATYPTILPPSGTCPLLSLTRSEADRMRIVAARLAATSRAAAEEGGAILVDMNALGARHHACSDSPWTQGWTNGGIAPFHPNRSGAAATAEAIVDALRKSPAGVAAVGEHDAPGHQAGSVRRQE
ncbi:MAG: SGNH/GDSL hydrolase family protein [Sphingomonas sp.]|nr:SGNH/GDSL hydrolase family protein [Sphingomonas sp.]